MMKKEVTILLVEDNQADVELIKESFKEGHICNNIEVVEDGVEAIKYVKKLGIYADKPGPDLIILDINLPKKNGFEVLEELKNNVMTKTIPIIVLTSSTSDEDIAKSYLYQANAYVVKPLDADKFISAVKKIGDFWLSVVRLL